MWCIFERSPTSTSDCRWARGLYDSQKHDCSCICAIADHGQSQRLSDGIKAAYPVVDWKAISGFRNRLAHGYLSVNMDIVWSVIQDYLPELQRAAEAMLADLEEQGGETSEQR